MVDGKLYSVPIYPKRSTPIRPHAHTPTQLSSRRYRRCLPHYPPLACLDELHQIIYLGCFRQPIPSQLFQSLLGI